MPLSDQSNSGCDVRPLRRSEMPVEVSLTTEQLCALVASDDDVTVDQSVVWEVIQVLDALGLIVRTEP